MSDSQVGPINTQKFNILHLWYCNSVDLLHSLMAPNGLGSSQTPSNQAVSLQKTEVSVTLISVVEFPPVEQTK